jgi:uncharacterized protein (DUF58 family)
MASSPLLDRAFLEKLERLALRWQKSFPGLVGGHNQSRFSGAGQEFLDHRNFHHGDDLRAVNWRAYMRLEKLFLKMFQVEPRVPVRLLVDTSVSMTANSAKFEYARRLAASLCYVGLVRLDTIELHSFSEKLGHRYLCTGGRHRFNSASQWIADMNPGGRTNFMGVVRDFISSYSQRGLVIIISDFLDDSGCEKPLQYLSDFGHEILVLQVWSEEDRTPPWTGELDLVDAETQATMRLQFDEAARERYTRAFDEYCESIRHIAARSGGRYVGLPITLPIEDALFGSMVRARGIA